MLSIKNLTKTYKLGDVDVPALNGVSLSVQPGEFVAVMGPSGSGKSSLLQIAGGLDTPTEGSVQFNAQSIHSFSDQELSVFRRRKLGFIFQFFNLLPLMTAAENVCLPMMLDGKSYKEVEARALDLLDRMGLKKRAYHRPSEMSGGELQRVAIARALITDPLLILADEPTGNLDSKSGLAVLNLLQQLVRETKQTILMVTHDRKAAEYGSRLITMRDGLIESDQIISQGL